MCPLVKTMPENYKMLLSVRVDIKYSAGCWVVMNEKLLSKKSVFAGLLHGDCPPYQAKLQLFSHQDPFEASKDRQRQHEVGGILTENTSISSLEAISSPPPDCLEMTQSLSLVMFRLPPLSALELSSVLLEMADKSPGSVWKLSGPSDSSVSI